MSRKCSVVMVTMSVHHVIWISFLILATLSVVLASEDIKPATTSKPKIIKRQLNPWQQMSALNTIQRQLQHLTDHIEESHATLDSLESFSRNRDKLNHQLRTIREDLILLKRALAWLARFTNLAKALVPNPFSSRTNDFSFPSVYFPEDFDDVSESNTGVPQEKLDFEPPVEAEKEDFPPFSGERFQERMLYTRANNLPRLEENRTIFEKSVEEEKKVTDEEIAFALPSNLQTNFKPSTEPDTKASESFQMSTFLLPPMQNRNFGRMRHMRESFDFLPNFDIYRRFKDLGEVPLEKHSFFDTPKSFRRSHYSSFEAPIR